MLLYRTIVMNAITDEVEPLLKKAIREALLSEIGPDWYNQKGINVMRYYEDFDKIQKRIEQNVDPLDTMDLTALFFLLLPYSKDSSLDLKNGLLPQIASYLKMDMAYLKRRLHRLRDIRNHAIHDDVDKNETPDNNFLENGLQEKKWLNEIEEIMKHFQRSFQLANYYVKLNGLIEKHRNKSEDSSYYAGLISETEAIRRECAKIKRLDFMEAPISTPLTGPSPWATSVEDLNELPWPSQQQPQQTPQQQQTISKESVNEAVNQAVNQVFKNLDTMNDKAIDMIDRVSNGLDKFKRFLDKKNKER